MGLNDEDSIEEFSEPPKIVKIRTIRVCILEKLIEGKKFNSFLFAYPYYDEVGGVVKVFNPYYKSPHDYKEIICDNKLLMWQSFYKIKKFAIDKGLSLIYEGPIRGEDGFTRGTTYEHG